MSYVLDELARQIWTGDVLPDGVAEVGIANGSWAWARPDRVQGRYGFCSVDTRHGMAELLAAELDYAFERAVSYCWFDSSYA